MAATTKNFPDQAWHAAFEVVLGALEEAECVLAPNEFLLADGRFKPLEFSWGLWDTSRLAWCCPRKDVHRLAPWLHTAAADPSRILWANERFVVGGTFAWNQPLKSKSRYVEAQWQERLRRYRRGVPAHPAVEREPREPVLVQQANRDVLIVGASGMGNVGDDLLGEVLASMLAEQGARARLSGPQLDPLRAAKYDAIVVGGGGLIYASRDGTDERQNLGNYLRFGPVGRHFGIPAALIGVADQDHAGGIGKDAVTEMFTRHTLQEFACATTRDAASAALLSRFGAHDVRTGCDLLFDWTSRARGIAADVERSRTRIALIGELYRYRSISEAIGGTGEGSLVGALRGRELDVMMMSSDDVTHARKTAEALRRAGVAARTVDLRAARFASLARTFAAYAAVITTRFHGLVMAAMTDTPVLALDEEDGKKARLLRELRADHLLIADHLAAEATAERLTALLRGSIDAIDRDKVDALAAQSEVHRAALRELLMRPSARPLVKGTSKPGRVFAAIKRFAVSRPRPFDAGESVGLCWAASSIETGGFANLGDSLSAVVVAALSGRPVRHVHFNERTTKLVAVGSIGHAIRGGFALIWGTGVSIRGGVLERNAPVTRYDVRAIRGRISAGHFKRFGIEVPDVYGDPVWLLPSIVNEPVEKKYELGVIPHIQDISIARPEALPKLDALRYRLGKEDASSGIAMINTWHEPTWEGLLAKLRLIRSCKRIASQSFHGLVIAEAYGIPCMNFRAMPGVPNGAFRVDPSTAADADPRVVEFYDAGGRSSFYMYSQQREQRSNWHDVIDAIDRYWEPFEYDPSALLAAFPLPLAYDPLRQTIPTTSHLERLRF